VTRRTLKIAVGLITLAGIAVVALEARELLREPAKFEAWFWAAIGALAATFGVAELLAREPEEPQE